ncbi:hypothetical protein BS47DRAFT_1364241 [Hydnum rufescens UP504]|uniref:Ubiquitin-like protease family profile domain-containing protein n=1 Tax=Hydnum rufescens UP504 TaxID=1448309 RepID=A0A9P6ASJ7_9AGAM|nr:hypothetical protein BS47DRAFT_1364241 [Hydnum rufescens UP504]
MSLSSASHVYDPPAEDAVVPSGALHHPREGQELGSGGGTPSMVQDPPAEDAVMHSGASRRPREDPELVGSTLPTLLLTWELSEASVERMSSVCIAISQNPSRGQAQDSCQIPIYRPLEEYPDLCTLTVASGEISADVGSMNVNGPWSADALSQRYALRGPSQLSRPSDFTRFPQRWNKHLPYLPYVYRHPSDPNTPQPRDLDPITNRFYLKKHYVDALAAFVGSASTTAQRWYSHIRRNGFHVPVPLPSCEYPGANFRRHFEHHDTKARIMADVEIFLQHGYLCRGYAQWLMRKFVACLSRELGMPCPHFGVDDKLIGAVFRMEDLEDSRVSGVVRGLERDGVPVFAATVLEPWSETVWDRIPCLKTPWRNTTNVSPGPEHDFLLVSVEYAVPFDHPFPWFSAPAYGYPGFYYQYRDEKYYEEQAFLEALVAVDPQQESIPLLTKSYEVVAKFLGPGPFFCARNPPISVFPLTNPDAPGALESARINPPLDPLLTTSALVWAEATAPHLPSEGGFITFRDGTLVNDDAINSYIDVLKMFARPTSMSSTPFSFSRLLDGFDKVATWHKDLRHPVFMHMERIIVPIHLKSQSHWATVSIDFKRRGFITFRDGTLVNDDAINSYIDVLKMFARPTVHVFNTFFFSRLLDGFDKVATWHKDLRHPVFTHMERIIVPIHLKSQSHWATVSIDFKRRIVTYMDSIFLPSTFEFVTEIMRKYLADLAALETCSFDLEAWTFIGSKDTSPQQTGTVDCGVFLIANIRNCAGIQPWKVLRPTEVPSARLQFMVDVVWGVIDYPRGYDHALQSIFPSHSPPAFILPDEPDYVHVPRPALPRPVPKIVPAPMPAVATVIPSGRNEQPSPQQRSWGDITENEGRDLIRNAAAGDVASYQRIMVVLDHHVRVKNKDATPLARYLRAHWRGKARGVYDRDFDWQEHSRMRTISRSQPGDDRSLHRGSLRDAGLLPSDRSESVHAESSSHHGRLPVDAEEQSTMEMNFAAISVDDVAMATASAPPMIAPPVIASPVVPPAVVPPIAPAAAVIPLTPAATPSLAVVSPSAIVPPAVASPAVALPAVDPPVISPPAVTPAAAAAVVPPPPLFPPRPCLSFYHYPFSCRWPSCRSCYPCLRDLVDGSEGQNALPYEQETLEEFRSMGALATSRSRVNKKRSKKQGRIVYRMSIYFKDYMLAQEVLESTRARAKAQNYLGVELITLPSVDYTQIGCQAMDLYYASVVYDRARSSEERDALLAVAPRIHINSAQMGPQFLEHDLYPIPPQLHVHSPRRILSFAVALQEQSEGSHSVSLTLRRFTMLLHAFWERKPGTFVSRLSPSHVTLRNELVQVLGWFGYTEEFGVWETFGIRSNMKWHLVLEIP